MTAVHVIVLDPGEVHDGRSGAPGGYAYRMLYIDADFVRAVAEDAEQRPSRDLVSDSPLIHDPVLAREIHAAWIARAASPVSLEADERLERIVRSIAVRDVQARADRPVLWQDSLRRVCDYMHDHIGGPITTTDLARVANVSRFQLTRRFQRMFGLPLHAYHLQVRLEEAKRRMAHGRSIAAVAADLGFVDQSHFHRRFRAHFGVTPAEWRRTAIQDA
jgi:AraC-like DNA-binding protein